MGSQRWPRCRWDRLLSRWRCDIPVMANLPGKGCLTRWLSPSAVPWRCQCRAVAVPAPWVLGWGVLGDTQPSLRRERGAALLSQDTRCPSYSSKSSTQAGRGRRGHRQPTATGWGLPEQPTPPLPLIQTPTPRGWSYPRLPSPGSGTGWLSPRQGTAEPRAEAASQPDVGFWGWIKSPGGAERQRKEPLSPR